MIATDRPGDHDMPMQTTSDESPSSRRLSGGESSMRAPRSGAVALAMTAVAPLVVPATPAWWLIVATLAAASIAAIVDLRDGRLPDRWVAAVAVAAIASAGSLGGSPVASAVLAAALAAALPLLLHVASPATLGFGDVKLAIALGAALGASGRVPVECGLAVATMLAMASGLGLIAAIGLARRAVPFGPCLVAGWLAAVLIVDHGRGAVPAWW